MGWKTGAQFSAGVANYSLRHPVQTGSGSHPVSYPMVAWGSCPKVEEAVA